jgi:hypothetical protein
MPQRLAGTRFGQICNLPLQFEDFLHNVVDAGAKLTTGRADRADTSWWQAAIIEARQIQGILAHDLEKGVWIGPQIEPLTILPDDLPDDSLLRG